MIVAALDLGTNTFLCLIAETRSGKVLRVLEDHVQVVRLGHGLAKQAPHQKRFHPEALQRAKECLSSYKKIIDQYKVEKILAAATSAARDVQNAEELFQIGRDLEIPIQVISGDDEARYSFLGAITEKTKEEEMVVLDVGGGSTELIYQAKNSQVAGEMKSGYQSSIQGKSVDVGAVRLTELFVTKHPISDDEIKKMRDYTRTVILNFSTVGVTAEALAAGEKKVIAVAGTPTNLAMLDLKLSKFDEEKIMNYRLSKEKLDEWIERLRRLTVEERCKLPGLDPGRADVIVAGAIILSETLRYLNKSELSVSTRGLRYGVAACL